ncbi:MAG TPA: hypothetical protein VKA32_06205 [Gammaproteobacteria bacterium]|nr:hypothetical protein [Gammaproteobacteria bacterium]
MSQERKHDYSIRDIQAGGQTADLDQYIDSLQEEPTGEGFRTRDYYLLVLTGIVIPALLLMWGID